MGKEGERQVERKRRWLEGVKKKGGKTGRMGEMGGKEDGDEKNGWTLGQMRIREKYRNA